jgi:hypothetical protein
MTTVYTVITGNFDNLRTPPPAAVEAGTRYVCFTDRPRSIPPWQQQSFPQMFGPDSRRNSRIPKMLPHLLLDTDESIYLDGAYVLQVAPSHLIRDLLGDADVGMFAHPGHASIHDERNFYQRIHNYIPADIEAQYQKYVAADLPITGEFWAGGFVMRRHNERTAAFNELWMREYLNGSDNDQFALYYGVVKSEVKVATVPGYPSAEGRLVYALHANSGCADNPGYESENACWKRRVDQIREICQCK